MANEELMALLQSLQGTGPVRALSPGFLAQLPALTEIAAAATGKEAGPERAVPAAAKTAASALRALGGGLTLLPVVGSLLRLFGGGKKEEPPPLETFALPAPIRAEAGLSASGQTYLIDRGVGDRIRPLAAAPAEGGPWAAAPSASGAWTAAPARQPQSGGGTAITVNVQAMDSQSFLDRREDIARAVREAMLQSHSLNDVVSEL
jgi:hypothetical protein